MNTTMKKMITTMMLVIAATIQVFAMSTSNVRQHARFLSDRMAYELDLTPYQYDDVYEINYDFIYSASRIMDDVVYGYRDAIEHYYRLLDYRNEDLRFVLNSRQYARFMGATYFYRPIYSTGRKWTFRVYTIYNNHKFFYYDAPRGYRQYNGGHSIANGGGSYYSKRYNHDRYNQHSAISGSKLYDDHGRNDFGVNRRERGNEEKNKINNYKNKNQQNRTEDPRYRDNSGNKNSPRINHRDQQNNSQAGNKSQGNQSGNTRSGRR